MMPKPHGLGLAPPENKPFLKRLHRSYAPPDTGGAAYALASAPQNAALDGRNAQFPADDPRKRVATDGRRRRSGELRKQQRAE